MAIFAAMWLLHTDGRLTLPVRLLLAAVSGVDAALLEQVRVWPRERNWLRFPWYTAAKGGGAFVMRVVPGLVLSIAAAWLAALPGLVG